MLVRLALNSRLQAGSTRCSSPCKFVLYAFEYVLLFELQALSTLCNLEAAQLSSIRIAVSSKLRKAAGRLLLGLIYPKLGFLPIPSAIRIIANLPAMPIRESLSTGENRCPRVSPVERMPKAFDLRRRLLSQKSWLATSILPILAKFSIHILKEIIFASNFKRTVCFSIKVDIDTSSSELFRSGATAPVCSAGIREHSGLFEWLLI